MTLLVHSLRTHSRHTFAIVHFDPIQLVVLALFSSQGGARFGYSNCTSIHCIATKQASAALLVCRLMLRCGIKRGRLQDDTELKLLQQFWGSASTVSFTPALGHQEAAMLQQLSNMR